MSPVAVAAAVTAKLAVVKKLVVHVLTVAAALLALGVLPEPVATYVSTAIAVAGALGVYVVRNSDTKATTTKHPVANPAGHGEIAMSAGAPSEYESKHSA